LKGLFAATINLFLNPETTGNSMPAAEIIAIGTELLLGEIQDTNTRFLARILRDAGIDLYRTTIIGDNTDRIASAIQESLTRCQIVITTGGLGPTVDDPTRQAVAQAVGADLEFHPELWDQILDRFTRFNRSPSENNRRQAFIPVGAQVVENQVGTAPAFIFETEGRAIISLPGVPREMEFLMRNKVMPYLLEKFNLSGTIKACVLHCTGVGESQIDELVADLETLTNPTVGLAAHPGEIDIRVTAKAQSLGEANQMIDNLVKLIEARVGDYLYGKDEDTLEKVVAQKLENRGWQLRVFEYSPETQVSQRLNSVGKPEIQCLQAEYRRRPESLTDQQTQDNLNQEQVAFYFSFHPGAIQQVVYLHIQTPLESKEGVRTYGGPPENGPLWATNTALDFLRRIL
jgi:nicotinamide-nucleotide amidase